MIAYWAMMFFFTGALFRRFVGRSVYIKGWKFPRVLKMVILVILAMLMYVVGGSFPETIKEALCMVWAIGWFVRYTNHTHGDYFYVEDTSPDEERSWWVGKILKAVFGKGNYYNFKGNFLGLMLGYLVPAFFASLTMPSHWFWVSGVLAPVCYTICEILLKAHWKGAGSAEYCHGGLMFILFFLNVVQYGL